MNKNIIDKLLKDFDSGHTEYQIRNFIVGSEVHAWHQYMQCLREIHARKNFLISSNHKIKKGLKFWKKKIEMPNSEDKKIKREMALLIKIALELRKKYNFENLSQDKKNILESEAWREKAKFMLCMDLFCIGRPTKETIDFIYKLPKKTKRELLTDVDPRDRQKIIEYLVG